MLAEEGYTYFGVIKVLALKRKLQILLFFEVVMYMVIFSVIAWLASLL